MPATRGVVRRSGESAEHAAGDSSISIERFGRTSVFLCRRSRFAFADRPTHWQICFRAGPGSFGCRIVRALAAKYGFEAVAPGVAYLTSDSADGLHGNVPQDATLACFEVLDTLPMRIKSLREWLRERKIGRVEVKKRGVDIDPARLAAELRSDGDEQATLLVCSRQGRTIAIVARRC